MNNINNPFKRLRQNKGQENKSQETTEYPQSLVINVKEAGFGQIDLLSEEGKNVIKNKVQELTNKEVVDFKFIPFFDKSILVKNIIYKKEEKK